MHNPSESIPCLKRIFELSRTHSMQVDIRWRNLAVHLPGMCRQCRQDEETQESVAMKKIENAFEHITCLGAQWEPSMLLTHPMVPWALSRQISKKNEADLVSV